MIVNLLTEHHLEFLSLIGGCRGSSESTLVKMSNYWKSHATAHLFYIQVLIIALIVCGSGGCSVVLGAFSSLAIVLLRTIELVALL